MTILLTLSQLEITGAEVYAIEIAEKLIDRGHTCFIMSDTLSLKTRAKYIPVNFNKRKLWNRNLSNYLPYPFHQEKQSPTNSR
jgi:hypothetical protein